MPAALHQQVERTKKIKNNTCIVHTEQARIKHQSSLSG
jgi:hypothetical protein